MFHTERTGQTLRNMLLRIASSRAMPVTYLLTILRRLTGLDLHRILCLICLKGALHDELQISAEMYAASLEDLQIRTTHDLVSALAKDGWRPLLVSNSICIAVNAIGRRLGYDTLSSKLEFVDGICQGRLCEDLTGRKKDELDKWAGKVFSSASLGVLTDNQSDVDLLSAASFRRFVLHKARRSPPIELEHSELIYV